ncbi:alpha/beta fold hydrolase [Microbacterium sp. SLBN-146]|uniref:alpha/beta fold hydrolase n=1 Tax=Microbacterium sp. SLBN-146 TaxID=2768457 RepID=UPI00115240DE|nr:alpha/beta hydrolase [Microbacterium sp. SLBN-146]TQJ30982.1 pimeloyl-ACP methyl ester carboxylesterase [Microbacterium sp. SLBN-146]
MHVEEFTHAGATLVAERRGSGRGVFLLIHGIGMGRSVFSGLTEGLIGTGRVIAVDLPGYGDAPEPARILTIERMADLVGAYLRAEVDRPAVVVGHSMGAQVALEVAVRHPDVVQALVMLGPSTDPTARSARAQLWRLVKDLAVEKPRVILRGAREYVRAGPRLRGKYRAMLAHRPEVVLDRVTVPTLVIRGENDVVSPHAWCVRVADDIPDARLVEIRGHGHETMIRDAAPAARAIVEFSLEN